MLGGVVDGGPTLCCGAGARAGGAVEVGPPEAEASADRRDNPQAGRLGGDIAETADMYEPHASGVHWNGGVESIIFDWWGGGGEPPPLARRARRLLPTVARSVGLFEI